MTMIGLTPNELRERLARGEPLVLLDVREDHEFAYCRIAGSRHVPLGELAARAGELDPDTPTVCICHHGVRSGQAAALLEHGGFAQVYNLLGGVERWAVDVDPRMPRY
jgi:rhodanese-related sulfurtransferase